jgi:hypothetical protein
MDKTFEQGIRVLSQTAAGSKNEMRTDLFWKQQRGSLQTYACTFSFFDDDGEMRDDQKQESAITEFIYT